MNVSNLNLAQSAQQNDMIKMSIRKEAISLAIASFSVPGAPVTDQQLMKRIQMFHVFMTVGQTEE